MILIDLAGTNLGNAAAVQLKAGNLLEVTENGNAYDLHLDPSQNFAGTSFHLAPDINGGTAIALGQATTVSSGQTVSNTSISNGNVQQVFGTAVSADGRELW